MPPVPAIIPTFIPPSNLYKPLINLDILLKIANTELPPEPRKEKIKFNYNLSREMSFLSLEQSIDVIINII